MTLNMTIPACLSCPFIEEAGNSGRYYCTFRGDNFKDAENLPRIDDPHEIPTKCPLRTYNSIQIHLLE